jgi:hypothetical protein
VTAGTHCSIQDRQSRRQLQPLQHFARHYGNVDRTQVRRHGENDRRKRTDLCDSCRRESLFSTATFGKISSRSLGYSLSRIPVRFEIPGFRGCFSWFLVRISAVSAAVANPAVVPDKKTACGVPHAVDGCCQIGGT